MRRNGAGLASAPISLGLLWHSINSGNLGVGALTVSNIALAREAAAAAGREVTFDILGFVDQGVTPYVSGPDVRHTPLDGRAVLPGGSYWRSLADLDAVLDIGGGDSFTDIYGGKRFTYLWLTKAMAIARGIPLILSPQTIGPFSRQPQSALAAWAMRRAELVVARDPLSCGVAKAMAPTARVIEAVDVAFALPYERRSKASQAIEVGLNVSGLLFNGGYSSKNEFGMQVDYARYTRRLVEELLTRTGLSVQLISHVNSDDLPQDDDRRIADMLSDEYPGVTRVADFPSPEAAKSYISGLDFLVAGRMHACIAAFSSGVPVVPVAYSRKFSGLFEGALGYPHLVPVAGFDTETAIAFTLDALDSRDALAEDVAAGGRLVADRLGAYREALVDLFRRLRP